MAAKNIVRKYVTFSAASWEQLCQMMERNCIGSEVEAVRFLISRGMIFNGTIRVELSKGTDVKKQLLFSRPQWEAIEIYRFTHRFRSTSDTIRYLVARGIQVEVSLMRYLEQASNYLTADLA